MVDYQEVIFDPTFTNPLCLVNANQVAHQLLVNGRGTMPTKPKRPVLPTTTVEGIPSVVSAFSEEEYRKRYSDTQVQQGSRHRRRTGGATKEGSKRHSPTAVELSLRSQTAVQLC